MIHHRCHDEVRLPIREVVRILMHRSSSKGDWLQLATSGTAEDCRGPMMTGTVMDPQYEGLGTHILTVEAPVDEEHVTQGRV